MSLQSLKASENLVLFAWSLTDQSVLEAFQSELNLNQRGQLRWVTHLCALRAIPDSRLQTAQYRPLGAQENDLQRRHTLC